MIQESVDRLISEVRTSMSRTATMLLEYMLIPDKGLPYDYRKKSRPTGTVKKTQNVLIPNFCLRFDSHAVDETFLSRMKTWLSVPDPSYNHSRARDLRSNQTGVWFVEGSVFKNWMVQLQCCIWLVGSGQ
jgi:hypothetical protein